MMLAIALCGCEVIAEGDRLIPVTPSSSDAERTHVLIEYTGFRCVNCPTAAETAQDLADVYGEQLIMVAMHPATNHFTQTKNAQYDYTCAAADTYYLFMGGASTTPFPTGNIDFRAVEGTYMTAPSSWAARLQQLSNERSIATISLEAMMDAAREVTIETRLESTQTLDAQMVMWIVEDSVLGAQVMPDGSNNMGYYHRHMLREAVGDEWGTAVHIGPEALTIPSRVTLPTKYAAEHCSIVCLLIDPTDRRIIEAKQTLIQQDI